MRKDTDAYAAVVRLLCEENIYINPGLSFERICRLSGVSPREADRYFRSELGMGGEEVLSSLRESFRERLCRRYGIII